jgi:hypothetical protein
MSQSLMRKYQDQSQQMSEWLDIMLSEIARKSAEETAAQEEVARRAEAAGDEESPEAKPN